MRRVDYLKDTFGKGKSISFEDIDSGDFDFKKFSKYRQVKIVRENGPGLRLVSKNGQWASGYASHYFDVDGNPLLAARILGEDLANYLGIFLLSKNEINIPDIKILNVKLDSLNDLLSQNGLGKIPIRFYESQDKSRHDPAYEYVERFIHNGELPFDEVLHDFSFHFLSILIPSPYLEPIRERGDLLLRFVDFIRSDPERSKDQLLMAMTTHLLRVFSREIDNVTGLAGMIAGAQFFNVEGVEPPEAYNLGSILLGEAWNEIGEDPIAKFHVKSFHSYTLEEWLERFLQLSLDVCDQRVQFNGYNILLTYTSTRNALLEVIKNKHSIRIQFQVLLREFMKSPAVFSKAQTTMVEFARDIHHPVRGLAPVGQTPSEALLQRLYELRLIAEDYGAD